MTTHWLANWPSMPGTTDNPFVSDGFLTALESSAVCNRETGWQPNHLLIDDRLRVPAYVKTHSWGEYVFDWAWANAYDQYGLAYYPKMVIAAPYTPSMGPRFLGARGVEDINAIMTTCKNLVIAERWSGFHILFPSVQEQQWLDQLPLLKRTDVQFHWKNRDYRDFDDFLDTFSSRKRKNVKKERQSISLQGLQLQTLEGKDITESHWNAFYQFYHATYLKRGRQGYLNKAFFDDVLANMRTQLVLTVAYQASKPVAAALFFKDEHTLYGRYWGCFDEFNNLHFEACYYQGIEYCIRNKLDRFDPGTQGEHKIARGFEPTYTHSYHWLSHPQFFEAARRFCDDEAKMSRQYYLDVQANLPFKQSDT